jgi:hypothetical protein
MVAGLRPDQEKDGRRNVLRYLNKKRYAIKFKKYEKLLKKYLKLSRKLQ